jgi:hypothetical protein
MRGGIMSETRQLATAVGLVAAALLGVASPARGQAELDTAVERARGAWLGHDVAALVEHSDTVRLRLPGIAASASVRPEQAARLLERYLGSAQERTFVLVDVRRLAEDHAYAEVARRYVVRGTDEELEETVFLGFRLLQGSWRLREVRIAP